MSKKIVISFPGSRGEDVPLLYFGAKVFENQGYEKIFVNPPVIGDLSLDTLYEIAEKVILALDVNEYEDIIFVAKSMGTVVSCQLKKKYNIPAKLVLFTPIAETLPYIKQGNDILLVAAGDKDRHLDTNILKDHCQKENIPYYIEPGVAHRMEVMGSLERDLEILGNVLKVLEKVQHSLYGGNNEC